MVRKIIASVLLCAWSATAQAQLTIEGPTWTVTSFVSYPVVGDSLIWTPNIFPDGSYTIFSGPGPNTGPFIDSIDVGFEAKSGYRITGYDLLYDIEFVGGEYVVQGGEFGLPPELKPGDVIFGSGVFDTGGGTHVDFPGGATPVIEHIDRPVASVPFPGLLMTFFMAVKGYEYCVPSNPNCYLPGGGGPSLVFASLTINSVTITPQVVAIPEPETWALMVAGLIALRLGGRRERRRTRGSRSGASG